MKNEQKFEVAMRIYSLLQRSDLNWHSWHWWKLKDSWFAQFEAEEIDKVAEEMAENGMIETNGSGFRRKEKTLKEKIFIKLWS